MEMPNPPSFRMIADAMLGKLAKWLRLLGYDVAYERKIEDRELIRRAREEDRLILTRDARLVGRRRSPRDRFLFIRDEHLPQQLRQVVRELNLSVTDHLFTRCVACNAVIETIPREAVREQVPVYVYETQTRFSRCPACGRTYWPGTHGERARERLQRLFEDGRSDPTGDPVGK